MPIKEVWGEKTTYDFTFGSDFMLYGRLPKPGSNGLGFMQQLGMELKPKKAEK